MPLGEKDNQGVEGVAKGVTSTVGNLAGGLTKTVGGVLGTAGRGLGETINNTTGTKVVGDGLQSVTNGVEDGGHRIGKATEDAGQWKK